MISKVFQNKFFRKYRSLILIGIDLFIVVFSYLLAFLIKNDFAPSEKLLKSIFDVKTIIGGLGILIIYNISFYIFKIYRSLLTYLSGKEIFRITISVVVATLTTGIIIWTLNHETTFIGTIATAGFVVILLMLGIRFAYRAIRDYENNKNNRYQLRKTLIVGAGDAGYILMKELEKNDRFKSKLVGFVDDNRYGMVVSGVPVLGRIADIPSIVSKKGIEVVYIAIPSASRRVIQNVIELCKIMNVETKIMRPGEELVEGNRKNQIHDVSIEDLLGRGVTKLSSNQISEYIKNQVVLVTGAAGSIGSQLCLEVFKFKPKQMLLLDINENGLYMLEQELMRLKRENKDYETVEVITLIVSIREYESLESIFKQYKIDAVYHAAAHKHVPLMETRPQEAIKNNIIGTKNVIDISILHQVKRVIMISTDKAVNPTNVMGASKRMTELILQSRGNNGVTKIAAVRFGNVLGSNGSVIPIFKRQIEKGGPITLTSKKIIRYFMTIPEAAQLVLQAGFYADKGEIFVLDMGEPVRILDLAENLIRLSGFTPYKDIDIVEIGLRPGEKMFEELQYSLEKTHKTENDMITVNEIIKLDRNKIDERVNHLLKLCDEPVNKQEIKEALFNAINIEGVVVNEENVL